MSTYNSDTDTDNDNSDTSSISNLDDTDYFESSSESDFFEDLEDLNISKNKELVPSNKIKYGKEIDPKDVINVD